MFINDNSLDPMIQLPYSNNLIYEPINTYHPSKISKKTNKPSNDPWADKFREIKKDDKNDEFDEFINSRLSNGDTEESDDGLMSVIKRVSSIRAND